MPKNQYAIETSNAVTPPLKPPPPPFNREDLTQIGGVFCTWCRDRVERTLGTPAFRAYFLAERYRSRLKMGLHDAAPTLPSVIPLREGTEGPTTITIPGVASDLAVTLRRAEALSNGPGFAINCNYWTPDKAQQIATLVQALVENIISTSDQPVVLCGHSMGGVISHAVAEALKRQHPEAPLSVVSYSTPYSANRGLCARVARVPDMMAAVGFDGQPSGRYPYLCLRGEQDSLVPAAVAQTGHTPVHTLPTSNHGCCFDAADEIKRVRAAIRLGAHLARRSVKQSTA